MIKKFPYCPTLPDIDQYQMLSVKEKPSNIRQRH